MVSKYNSGPLLMQTLLWYRYFLFLGEHIDYCGYSVLPMAIEQDVVIAAAATKSQEVLLSNVKSDLYRYLGDLIRKKSRVLNWLIVYWVSHSDIYL